MAGEILLIHRDAAVRAAGRRILEAADFEVTEAADPSVVWKPAVVPVRPDVIVLPWAIDVTRSVLARLRDHEETRHARLLVLANRDAFRDSLNALECGADDFLYLPLDGAELVARVNACLRRPPAPLEPEQLRAGPVVLDKAAHSLSVAGVPVELAPAEFRLMTFFLENPGRVFSRNELLRRAWSRNVKAGPRTVDVHVRRLRRIFEQFGCDEMIQTVRGFGYRFAPRAPEQQEQPSKKKRFVEVEA